MFERFTDRARRVLVLAQEEARLLNHGFIGTEHILLGLIREDHGVAARALEQMDISLEVVREKAKEVITLSGSTSTSPPFTPRAKKVMELSLREALRLGRNDIDTEHLLLGLLREGEGVAAHVLVGLGAGLEETREVVLALLPVATEEPMAVLGEEPMAVLGEEPRSLGDLTPHVACSFCGRRQPETGRLFDGTDASICEHCVRHWSEVLSTGEKHLPFVSSHASAFGAIEATGPPPENQDAARAEIALAFSDSATSSEDGHSVPSVEGGAQLGPTLLRAHQRRIVPATAEVSIDVVDVMFIDANHGAVWFTISIDGRPRLSHRRGDAVVVDGAWKMARSTFCDLMTLAGVECPPVSG